MPRKPDAKKPSQRDYRALEAHFEKFFILSDKRLRLIHGHRGQRWMSCSFPALRRFMEEIPDDSASILDCGAGASTWVLRKAFKNVVTLDTPDQKKHWTYIKYLCGQHGLSTTKFVLDWDKVPPADYVFYDYGTFLVRPQHFADAWERCRVLMYADDADTRPGSFATYREQLWNFAESVGAEWTDCEEAIDKYKRWGVVLRRPAEQAAAETGVEANGVTV